MCWVCDHPRASRQDWIDHLRKKLAEQCWVVIYVQREKYRPPYAYTVGLAGTVKDLAGNAIARSEDCDHQARVESRDDACDPVTVGPTET